MTVDTESLAFQPRRFQTLGKANHGWLNANFHFSFSNYYDPTRVQWGNIRVWNDDEIAPKSGFPAHSHDNMEIITYVREGAITHTDSMGNVGRTQAGDVQVMSAGTGITHSEYNQEDTLCRLFQIWILPRQQNVPPRWDARQFSQPDDAIGFNILASGYGEAGALEINADARVFGAALPKDTKLCHALSADNYAYLVVASGSITIDGVDYNERDGVAIAPDTLINITANSDAKLVMVESV
jgi:quercetin 2,3-dioxygenase